MSTKKTLLSLLLCLTIILAACTVQPAAEQSSVEAVSEVTGTEQSNTEEMANEEVATEDESVSETVELTILHNWGPDDSKGPILESIFDAFMAENPNILIKEEILPDDEIFTKVEVSYLGGQEADLVFQNYFGPSLEWVDDGVTVPVTDYIEAWGLKNYYLDAALVQYTRDDGEIAAFPLEGFNWPIWYNTDIFEEAGVEIPTTSEGMIAAAEAIRAAGYEPFATGGSDWTGARLSQMFMVSGLSEAEAKELLANGGFSESEAALDTMQAFVDWRDNGVFATNAEGLEFNSMNELFFAGKAAMMHAGSWSYTELPEDLQDNVVLGGLPLTDLGAYDRPTAWAGFTAKGIHITRNGSQKIEAVEKFVTFMLKPENVVKFVEQSGMIPPYAGLEVDESVLNPLFVDSLSLPFDVSYVTLAETIVPGPVIEQWDKVANDSFIPNQMTAEEILAALDEIYKEYQQ